MKFFYGKGFEDRRCRSDCGWFVIAAVVIVVGGCDYVLGHGHLGIVLVPSRSIGFKEGVDR